MFPGDDILNDMEKMSVELVLESDSNLVTIMDRYSTANVIVVDDDSKSTSVNAMCIMLRYYESEMSDWLTRVNNTTRHAHDHS